MMGTDKQMGIDDVVLAKLLQAQHTETANEEGEPPVEPYLMELPDQSQFSREGCRNLNEIGTIVDPRELSRKQSEPDQERTNSTDVSQG